MPRQSADTGDYNQYERELAREIGARIKQRRGALALTQKTVMERIEVRGVYISRSQYSRIENGQQLPSAAEVIALAQVLNVSFDWLLLGHESSDHGR